MITLHDGSEWEGDVCLTEGGLSLAELNKAAHGEKKMSKQCENVAAFRYTWPGRDESFICAEHAPKLRAVAEAMGLPLQVIPLVPAETDQDCERCRQQVK